MCAIAGLWTDQLDTPALRHHALRMGDAMQHRGPDGQGVWVEPEHGLALSHRRLAIRDTSVAAAQPMLDATRRHVLVFNGEIDNHQDWRRQLTRAGCRLGRSKGDTEALLQALIHWGAERVCREAQGMFAFAWWDRATGQLVLARDRLGKKPLYVTEATWGMAFASQLQALREVPLFEPRMDAQALAGYLQWGYVQGPGSMLSGVQVVEPGTWQLFENGRRIARRRYWSVDMAVAQGLSARIQDPREAREQLDATLRAAVRDRLAADVPVGAFLSGGIDSALVVALMQQEGQGNTHTFSIGFDDPAFDESNAAAAIAKALGTRHDSWVVNGHAAAELLPALPRLVDEPLADASQIPTTCLAQRAGASVKVVLTGDGGDEAFGGYARYRQGLGWMGALAQLPSPYRTVMARTLAGVRPAQWASVAQWVPESLRPTLPASKVDKLGRWLMADTPAARTAALLQRWQPHEVWSEAPQANAHGHAIAGMADTGSVLDTRLSPSERQQRWEMAHYLGPDLLAKMDRATMWASVEARSPLLDERVVSLAWRLSPSLKAEGPRLKEVLRQLLAQHLPPSLFDRPKRGFSAPLGRWLQHELREPARELLDSLSRHARGHWNTAAIESAWQRQQQGISHEVDRLWGLMVLELWRRHWGLELP